MKTFLRQVKRLTLFRLVYRLVCWINYPTSRERMWHMFYLGKQAGIKEALKTLPIVKVQPKQEAQITEQLHLPPGMWSKQYFEEHPEHRATIPSQQHERAYWPEPFEEHAWLNSKPRKSEQDDPENTEEVPAIMKLKHAGRKK